MGEDDSGTKTYLNIIQENIFIKSKIRTFPTHLAHHGFKKVKKLGPS